MDNNNYAALEIANDGVKLLVGYYFQNKVYVLHALQSTSSSLTNGYIDDVRQVTLAIKEVVNSAESQLQTKIDEVVLCLPPLDLIVKTESATTSTVNSDSMVSNSDMVNVTMMIRKKVMESGKKVVSITPYRYLLDNGQAFKALPDKTYSNTLTVEADSELIDEALYDSYQNVVEAAGLRVATCVIAPHAAAKLLETYDQIPLQYMFLDIGAKMTSLSIVVENRLLFSTVTAFGGEDIKRAVAKEFAISLEAAERYIHIYGLQESPSFDYRTEDGFTLSELKGVIVKALQSLLSHIRNFVNEYDLAELPTMILSGGTANLYELSEFLRETFDVSVMVFNPVNFGARNKSYVNLIGAIKCISLNPPKTFHRRNQDFTLTRVGLSEKSLIKNKHDSDESL